MAATLVVFAALTGAAFAAPRIEPPHTGRASSGATSLNWAGYSATGSSFTSVTATWTQPAVKARTAETYAAFWVGLDGDGSDTVEQIGTMGYTFGGRSYYVAWYEMYPAAMQTDHHDGQAGRRHDRQRGVDRVDVVHAHAQRRDERKDVHDDADERDRPARLGRGHRRGARGRRDRRRAAARDLGLVSFTGCAVDGGTLAAAGASSIDMVDSAGDTIASTSALGGDAASSPSPTTSRRPR